MPSLAPLPNTWAFRQLPVSRALALDPATAASAATRWEATIEPDSQWRDAFDTFSAPCRRDDEADRATPADGAVQRFDPLRWLAEAAGYGDGETWWDHLVGQRSDSLDLFGAIAEMMAALRQEAGGRLDALDAQREASMRIAIRQALKQGHERIAVVCGAWHVPVLASLPSAKSDADLLKGPPKEKWRRPGCPGATAA